MTFSRYLAPVVAAGTGAALHWVDYRFRQPRKSADRLKLLRPVVFRYEEQFLMAAIFADLVFVITLCLLMKSLVDTWKR